MDGPARLSDFERGVVIGLLAGQGSFGGDGKQPQLTLRMHVRHEALLRWLVDRFPRSRLYGPYDHAARSYFQWTVRGRALVEDVLPALDVEPGIGIDPHAAARVDEMRRRYAGYIARAQARWAE